MNEDGKFRENAVRREFSPAGFRKKFE